MKEPELEEESLRLAVRGRQLAVELQTMAERPETVTLTRPSGDSLTVAMQDAEPGLWRGQVTSPNSASGGPRPAASPGSSMSGRPIRASSPM